jgi:hypothetical protein
MKTWEEQLSGAHPGAQEKYGPRGDEIQSALTAISEAQWFAHVGEPMEHDDTIVPVHSWEEALRIFDHDELDKYDAAVNGLPSGEC